MQAVEMLVELEDFTLVQAQPFPHGIAALDDGVERTYARVVAVEELAVDIDEQIAVLLVERLQHIALRRSAFPGRRTAASGWKARPTSESGERTALRNRPGIDRRVPAIRGATSRRGAHRDGTR